MSPSTPRTVASRHAIRSFQTRLTTDSTLRKSLESSTCTSSCAHQSRALSSCRRTITTSRSAARQTALTTRPYLAHNFDSGCPPRPNGRKSTTEPPSTKSSLPHELRCKASKSSSSPPSHCPAPAFHTRQRIVSHRLLSTPSPARRHVTSRCNIEQRNWRPRAGALRNPPTRGWPSATNFPATCRSR